MEMTDRELLETVSANVGQLTQDLGKLTQDVGQLTQDLGKLSQDVETLKDEMHEVKKSVIHIENDHGSKLKALFDGYVQNSEKLDRIEKEVSRQEEVYIRKIK